MAGRDLHGVTCHQPSPEGLKVPWLEPALLAGSATNSVNSGDRFPPGGKHGAPPPFPNLCREVPCDGRHAAMIHWSSVETTFTYIYIYIHTIFYIIYIPVGISRTRVPYKVSFSAFVIPKLVLGPPFCSKDTL
jgi:hypothetical protein